jgi:hypothetical protein
MHQKTIHRVITGLALIGMFFGLCASQSSLAEEPDQAEAARHAAEQYLANPQLVNSIFASGSVSTRLRSTNYQMIGTFGEPALPASTTTIASSNFRHQPGFLATVPFTNAAPTLLAIYALAFDTNPLSAGFLVPYYAPLVDSIIKATQADSGKIAVVLVDLDGTGDTSINVIQSGKVSAIPGLPTASGVLSTTLHEYNMGDGATLGGFLKWARQAYMSTETTFTFVGHNGPVVADASFTSLFNNALRDEGGLRRPPRRIIAPDKTDYHPLTMLSTYQLALALQIGSQGHDKFALIDLVHCFAGSIEELYEIAASADTITASPNYAYINPEMVGKALASMQTTMTSAQLASTVIDTYDRSIPPERHPRLMVAIDAAKLEPIKTTWDVTSHYLLEAFAADPTDTRNKLLQAYGLSAKYDTSFCDQTDWRLQPPDGLSDLADFAAKLRTAFGATSSVGIWAGTTGSNLAAAILDSRNQPGEPWFGLSINQPSWAFAGRGISLYADFQTFTFQGSPYLNWQSEWYTKTVSTQNPHPYAFIQGGYEGHSWSDVFARFWQGTVNERIMCFPIFPAAQNTGELAVLQLISPLVGSVSLNSPVRLSAVIKTDEIAINPFVSFKIIQQNTVVFSSTMSVGLLMTGTHQIDASSHWIPNNSANFTIEVAIDPQGQIIEPNESNNVKTMTGSVAPTLPDPRPIISGNVVNNLQWIAQTAVPVRIIQNPSTTSAPVQQLTVQVYQYRQNENPYSYIPVKRSEQTIDVSNLTSIPISLPSNIEPGPVVLHIWGYSTGGISVDAAVIRFNYAPANVSLPVSKIHYYLWYGKTQAAFQLSLDVPNNANADLVAWYPVHYAEPNIELTNSGDKTLLLNPLPFSGRYIFGVVGSTSPTTSYTLSGVPNGAAPDSNDLPRAPDADLPTVRPRFEEPLTLEPFDFHVYFPLLKR